jgi:hypothetical protein
MACLCGRSSGIVLFPGLELYYNNYVSVKYVLSNMNNRVDLNVSFALCLVIFGPIWC